MARLRDHFANAEFLEEEENTMGLGFLNKTHYANRLEKKLPEGQLRKRRLANQRRTAKFSWHGPRLRPIAR